jgi:hypothetical protein
LIRDDLLQPTVLVLELHLAADSLVLRGSGMPNSSAHCFQGTTQFNGSLGGAFGDDLHCAGGSVVRLAIQANAGGASQYPASGDAPVSVRGLVAARGSRAYQVWYRNAASLCMPSAFNSTNGCAIVWHPCHTRACVRAAR